MKLFNTKADKYKKLIIQNPDEKEDGYYGGINEKGVSYVSTFVRVAENQVSYIRRPYVRLILDAATAKEAVEMIKSFNPRIGGNMLIADKNECFGIEGVPEKYFVEKISGWSVKTNHFLTLPNRNLSFNSSPSFEKWSKTHQKRAKELIAKSSNVEDLKNILKDRKNSDSKTAICTTRDEDKCFTHSAFVVDPANIRIYYAQGCPQEVPFVEYNFTDKLPEVYKTKNESD
ncbi:MAG: carcinine hydrolase/isopenicillin-N N-acyltransferase family protein [Candidatus Beckwithbacteria bacterium]